VSAGGDAVGVLAIEGVESVEEGFGFGAETEEEGRAEDASEAEVVVVHGPEPVLGAAGKICEALDGDAGRGDDLAESIEAEHALKGLAEAALHSDGRLEDVDGGGVEDGGGGVGSGRLREREEPLDEVMDVFEAVVVPGKDFGEGAAFVVRGAVAVEGNERRWFVPGQRWIQPLRIIISETLPTTIQRRTP
jgi:hypothetical protein